MCVGNEWRNGVITNLSPGATIDKDEYEVPGKTDDDRYGKTKEQCMNSCRGDDRCTSFTLTANTNITERIETPGMPSCRLYQKLGSSVNVNDIISSEWGHRKTAIQYFSGETFPEKYRYSGGEIEAGDNKFLSCDLSEADGLCNTQWNNTDITYKTYGNRPPRNRATTIAWGDGAENAPFKDHKKRKEIYLAGVDREFCPVDFVKHYGKWRNNDSVDISGTWHGMGSEVLKMGDNTEGLWSDGSGSRNPTDNCTNHPDVNVNASLDDCYRNLNCDWSWFTGKDVTRVSGGRQSLAHTSENDPGTSSLYYYPINSSALDTSRRVCHKKNFNKNNSEYAVYVPDGGASLSPTRMVVDGKLKFGVMPPKNPKSGDYFWKDMIITSIGDSSQE